MSLYLLFRNRLHLLSWRAVAARGGAGRQRASGGQGRRTTAIFRYRTHRLTDWQVERSRRDSAKRGLRKRWGRKKGDTDRSRRRMRKSERSWAGNALGGGNLSPKSAAHHFHVGVLPLIAEILKFILVGRTPAHAQLNGVRAGEQSVRLLQGRHGLAIDVQNYVTFSHVVYVTRATCNGKKWV